MRANCQTYHGFVLVYDPDPQPHTNVWCALTYFNPSTGTFHTEPGPDRYQGVTYRDTRQECQDYLDVLLSYQPQAGQG